MAILNLKMILIVAASTVVACRIGDAPLSWKDVSHETLEEQEHLDNCTEQLDGREFTIHLLGSDLSLTVVTNDYFESRDVCLMRDHRFLQEWDGRCHGNCASNGIEFSTYGKYIYPGDELCSGIDDTKHLHIRCFNCNSQSEHYLIFKNFKGTTMQLCSGMYCKWNISVKGDGPKQERQCLVNSQSCTSSLIGKTVQFESTTRQNDYFKGCQNGPVTSVIADVDKVRDPVSGFSWRVHPSRTKDNVYLENRSPQLKKHFVANGCQEMKYFGHNDHLYTLDNKHELSILCDGCSDGSSCQIVRPYGHLIRNFGIFKIRFNGRPNGDEKVTVWENSNCSPSGQTLTFEATYEEGTSDTTTSSSGHSIETGADFRAKAEFEAGMLFAKASTSFEVGVHFNYGHDWSKSTQLMKQVRTSKTITVKIPPGQKVALKQWRGQFGDLEVLSSVEYLAEYCPVEIPPTAEAIDKDQRIFHRPNCHPGNPEVSVKIFYNRGIDVIGKNWNHAEVISATDPEVIHAIATAIYSSDRLTRKDDWIAMNLKHQAGIFEKNLEYNNACSGISVPPGKVLSVYQLVLTYGPYVVYSNKIWPVYNDCP